MSRVQQILPLVWNMSCKRCMKIRILLQTWFQPSALGKREQRILNLISLENAPHTSLALFLLDNLVCLSFVHYKRECQWAYTNFRFCKDLHISCSWHQTTKQPILFSPIFRGKNWGKQDWWFGGLMQCNEGGGNTRFWLF